MSLATLPVVTDEAPAPVFGWVGLEFPWFVDEAYQAPLEVDAGTMEELLELRCASL